MRKKVEYVPGTSPEPQVEQSPSSASGGHGGQGEAGLYPPAWCRAVHPLLSTVSTAQDAWGEGWVIGGGAILICCLISLARPSNTVLNWSMENVIFVLFFILRENALFFTTEYDSCGSVTNGFYCVEVCSFHTFVFIVTGYWIFPAASSASIEMIVGFLFFILIM